MRLQQTLALIACIVFSLPATVLARRGGGRGGGSSGGSNGGSDSSSFSLDPLIATIFSFCVAFAFFTALQALQAANNIYRRARKQPLSIATPEFSVGPIFPSFLLLSTLTLMTAYIVQAVYWGVGSNQSSRRSTPVSDQFVVAWAILSVFANIFLISALLALISHREKVLLNASGLWHTLKMVADGVLVTLLLALGIAYIGLRDAANRIVVVTGLGNATSDNAYIAYISVFLIAVLVIAVSATNLYLRAQQSPVNDHKILPRIAFIISPIFVLYPITAILTVALPRNGVIASAGTWYLVLLIVSCVVNFIVFAICLKLGMPFLPKQGKETVQEVRAVTPPHKVYQEA